MTVSAYSQGSPGGSGSATGTVEASAEVRGLKVTLAAPSWQWKADADAEAAILLEIPEGRHIYGRDGGGGLGLPTSVKWTLPEGFTLGEEAWPDTVPEKQADGSICPVYSGRVLLRQTVKVSASVKPGRKLAVRAKVSWLDCSDKGCMPGSTELEHSAVIIDASGQAEPSSEAALFADPVLGSTETNAAAASSGGAENSAKEDGVSGGTSQSGGAEQAYAPAQDGGTASQPSGSGQSANSASYASPGPAKLAAAAGMAFLGGIILNFMPCVLPVLSLKVLSFAEAGAAEEDAAKRASLSRRRGLAFGAGILLTFWAAAAFMLILRSMGHELGWGFQMQSKPFIAFLAVLFLLISLNLWGVFEFGLGLTALGGAASGRSGLVGSAAGGALTVIASAPCTAPFMGTALGLTLASPAYVSLIVFTFLAAGMSLPYIVLAFWPGLSAKMPRPGRWMESLKQFLAFPLIGTCVYFVLVFDLQAGPEAAAMLMGAMVTVSLAAWLYGRFLIGRSSVAAWLGVAASAVLALALIYKACSASAVYCPPAGAAQTGGTQTASAVQPGSAEQAPQFASWSPEAQRKALASGRPVFIDFGAAWCLTCRLNESTVLSSARAAKLFADNNVVLLKADWTSRDDSITRALQSYGRSGVPLYVFYAAGTAENPHLFSELLTEKELEEVIGGKNR